MKRDKQLLNIITESDEDLMLGEKNTVVIYTDASIENLEEGEFRSGHGSVILFRKKKRFGFKAIAEGEVKKSKDKITDLEYLALIKGIKEAIFTWGGEFNEAYVVSDSTTALKRLTDELISGPEIQFDIKLYWIKGHQKYLLNELADGLSKGGKVEKLAMLEEALIIPSEEPYALLKNGNELVGGIQRAYHKGSEREKAFRKLLKTVDPYLLE